MLIIVFLAIIYLLQYFSIFNPLCSSSGLNSTLSVAPRILNYDTAKVQGKSVPW